MKTNQCFFILLFCISVLSASCIPKEKISIPNAPTPPIPKVKIDLQKKPKNIIFMIGDGMGLTQITAGMYSNDNQLELERCQTIGLHKPYAANNLITDSAAGATAFACGVKTYNGAIGVDADTIASKTILEEAIEKGMATGLVVSSTIVHATPASFASHQKSRKMYEEIAVEMAQSGVNLMIGGGLKFFNRRSIDKKDLVFELKSEGYIVTDFLNTSLSKINSLIPDDKEIKERGVVHFTADGDPLPVSQGRDYLPYASSLAMDYLDHKSDSNTGFFLMIEGSQIDWGGHANQGDYIVTEMLDFNDCIRRVLDWAEQDGETLVVITADHETGGFAINPGSKMDSLNYAFTSDYHTAAMIPVFAFGPGQELFQGIYENSDIYYKLRSAYGW